MILSKDKKQEENNIKTGSRVVFKDEQQDGDIKTGNRVVFEDEQQDSDIKTDYGYRADGTRKGSGYFGELKRPDGNISTELSIGVNIDGKETEIPLLVPTLTEDEKQYLLSGNKETPDIIQKAVDHAKNRIINNKSPFADSNDYTQQPIQQFMPNTQQPQAPQIGDSLTGGFSMEEFDKITDLRAREEKIRNIPVLGDAIKIGDFVGGVLWDGKKLSEEYQGSLQAKNPIAYSAKRALKETARVAPMVLGGFVPTSLKGIVTPLISSGFYTGVADTIEGLLEGESFSEAFKGGAVIGATDMVFGKALESVASGINKLGEKGQGIKAVKKDISQRQEAVKGLAEVGQQEQYILSKKARSNSRKDIEIGDYVENKKRVIKDKKEAISNSYDDAINKANKNYDDYRSRKMSELETQGQIIEDINRTQVGHTTKLIRETKSHIQDVFNARYDDLLRGDVGTYQVSLSDETKNVFKKANIDVPNNLTVKQAHDLKLKLSEKSNKLMKKATTQEEAGAIREAIDNVIDEVDRTLSEIPDGFGDAYSTITREYRDDYIPIRDGYNKVFKEDVVGSIEPAVAKTNKLIDLKKDIDYRIKNGLPVTEANYREQVGAYKYYADSVDVLRKYGKDAEADLLEGSLNRSVSEGLKLDNIKNIMDSMKGGKSRSVEALSLEKQELANSLDETYSQIEDAYKRFQKESGLRSIDISENKALSREVTVLEINKILNKMPAEQRSKAYHALSTFSYMSSSFPNINQATKATIKLTGLMVALSEIIPELAIPAGKLMDKIIPILKNSKLPSTIVTDIIKHVYSRGLPEEVAGEQQFRQQYNEEQVKSGNIR